MKNDNKQKPEKSINDVAEELEIIRSEIFTLLVKASAVINNANENNFPIVLRPTAARAQVYWVPQIRQALGSNTISKEPRHSLGGTTMRDTIKELRNYCETTNF
tara:strand:+ start:751 stop:1062 length:312 start_codon:yes stop_codon:yes gene_type:complete